MEKGFEGLGIGDEEQGLFGQEDCPELASGDEETADGSFLAEDQIEIGPSLPLACVQALNASLPEASAIVASMVEGSYVDTSHGRNLIHLCTSSGAQQKVVLTPGLVDRFAKNRDAGVAKLVRAQTDLTSAQKRLREGREEILVNGVLVLIAEKHYENLKRAKVTNAQDRIANEQARREEIAHMEQQLKELKRSYK